jgi:hypothetical protein
MKRIRIGKMVTSLKEYRRLEDHIVTLLSLCPRLKVLDNSGMNDTI